MNRLLTTLIALTVAGLVQAAEPVMAESASATASSVASKTGHAIRKGATVAGEAVATTVERTEEGVKKGARKASAAVRKGAKKTAEVVEKGAEKIRSAVTSASASN